MESPGICKIEITFEFIAVKNDLLKKSEPPLPHHISKTKSLNNSRENNLDSQIARK